MPFGAEITQQLEERMTAMRHTEIIKAIMKVKGMTQESVAYALGLANSSAVSLRLRRKYGTIMNTVDILDALGYEMVIRPATKEDPAPNEYVIHSSDYEETP